MLENKDKATFYSPTEAWVMPAPSSKKPEEREFAVDSGASMHMLSKKDLSSEELETLRSMGKCKQTRKHKYAFTILISS